jgi:membrane protease YdiL (CAAX protease family)
MKQTGNNPLILFFILSLLFISLVALPGILINYGVIELEIPFIPIAILGSWSPNLVAFFIIAFVIKQKGGIKALLRRWTMWRVSPWWYLVAFSPIAVSLLAALLYFQFDSQVVATTNFPGVPFLLGFLVISLVTGAMGEELGWRGFALPWLQTRFNALWASLILGVIWGLWHLPLWFTGMGWEETSFWLFAWVGIAMTVILTWICNSTRGNMLLVTLFHMSYNFGMGLIGEIWSIPLNKIIEYSAIGFTTFMIVVIIVNGPSKLSRIKGDLPINREKKTWKDID